MALLLLFSQALTAGELPKDVTRVPVSFSGGHETERRDGGRPVVLIAAALGVPSEVFREAFSGVHPAREEGGPSLQQAQQNKAVLMKALGPYGITNDRLDEVSNYYRYRPQMGELWKTRAATASALVREGKIIGFEIVDAGAGYSSAPSATVPGFPAEHLTVQIAFDQDLKTNGHITSLSPAGTAAK